MENIEIIVSNNADLFMIFNCIEFVVALLMLLFSFDKSNKNQYIICLYLSNYLFGMLFFYVFKTITSIFVGIFVGSVITVIIILLYSRVVFMISVFCVLMKLVLLCWITLFDDYNIFIVVVLAIGNILIAKYIEILTKKEERLQNSQMGVTIIFSTLEISGAIVQFFGVDIISYAKILYDESDILELYLYLFKVDYRITDYQWPYIIFLVCFFASEVILIFLLKILRKLMHGQI
jgi:hypothetical protein